VTRDTLFDDREYDGLWSVPDAPGQEVAGTASYRNGRIILKLYGRLPGSTGDSRGSDFRPVIINGRRHGKKITLYQTRELVSSDEHSQFSASWMLVGRNFYSEEELRPPELSVEYTYLERWAMDNLPFHVNWERAADGVRTMTHTPPEGVELDLPQEECKVILVHFDSPNMWGNAASWKYSCRLFIQPSTPQTLSWYMDMVASLSRLMSLLIGRTSIPVSSGFAPLDIDERTEEGLVQGPVEVLWDGFRVPPDVAVSKEERERYPYVPLLSLEEVRPNIDTVFNSWFSQEQRLEIVHNLLLAVMDNPSVHVEHRLLTLAQALELFHRCTASGGYLEKEDFQKTKATLIDAIPDSTPESVKKIFKDKLQFLNQWTLQTRLQQLFNRFDQGTKRAIMGEYSEEETVEKSPEENFTHEEEFIRKIKSTRNNLTHLNYKESSDVPDPVDLIETIAQTRRLLTAALLQNLGVREDAIALAVSRIKAMPIHWHRFDDIRD